MARREEMQTTINWDAASKTAEIFTVIPTDITKLNKMCEKHPDHYKLVRVDKWGGHHYECPASRVRFSPPASEAQREAARKKLQCRLLRQNTAGEQDQTPSTPSDDTE